MTDRAIETGWEIVDLFDRPDAVDDVVGWIDREWGAHAGRTLDQTRARFSEHIRRGELPITRVIVAEGRAAAVASLRETDSFDYLPGARPWICNVYVAPDCRKRGFAGELCSTLEEDARALGYEQVYLATVIPEDSLYHRIGFLPVGQVDNQGTTYHVLRKKLR